MEKIAGKIERKGKITFSFLFLFWARLCYACGVNKFVLALKKGFEAFENALFVECSCLVCGRECADTQTLICEDCKKDLIKISGHVCKKCGMPIEKSQLLCDECKNSDLFFDMARAAFLFDDKSANIVYGLKYFNHKYNAKHMAILMIEPLQEFGKFDMFVPVPLHPNRFRERGYNQSELLANELSALTSIPTNTTCLARKIETETQTGKTKAERAANMVGAFEIKNKIEVVGKSVVLIDDVFTTGATVNECARVLKRAGAAKVFVLTFLKTTSFGSKAKTKRRTKH